MATIKIKGDTSGEISLTVPGVAGTNTLTLPASTGNVITDNYTGNVALSGDLNVDNGTLYVDSTNNRVGITDNSPELTLEVQNVFGVIYVTIADDAVATIPAPKNMGFLSIVNNPLSNTPNQGGIALIAYDCGTSKQIQYVVSSYTGGQGTLSTSFSNLYNTTNLTGTTGPDAAYSVSCATNYNIQVENRTGATSTFALTFF